VLDSSFFVPIPALLRKIATILLLAFSLFELVAALSQCLCSESNKKNGEVGEYPQYAKIFLTNKIVLITSYVQVRTMIVIVKCVTITRFFIAYAALCWKSMIHILLSSLETVHDTVQYRYSIFSLLYRLLRIRL